MTAACVCAEINTRHCPVHGQGDSAASSYDPLDARLGRTSSEPVETTKGKPVRSCPLRKKSDAACTCGWPETECLRRVLGNGPPFPPEPCEAGLTIPVRSAAQDRERRYFEPTPGELAREERATADQRHGTTTESREDPR